MAANGIEPATAMPASAAAWLAVMVTPPREPPSRMSTMVMIRPKAAQLATFAPR